MHTLRTLGHAKRSGLLPLILWAVILVAWGVPKSVLAESPTITSNLQNRSKTGAATISFTVNGLKSENNARFHWNFGDGNHSRSLKTPETTHRYTTPGNYTIILTIQRKNAPPESVVHSLTVSRPLSHPPPAHSSRIIYHPEHDQVWAVHPDNDTVSCVDAERLTRRMNVAVPEHPTTLARGPDGRIWVVSRDDPTITVIDPETGKIREQIALPRASRPFGITFDPAHDRAGFVTLEATGTLCRINPDTGRVQTSVRVGPRPRHLTITSNGQLFVARYISPSHRGEVFTMRSEDLNDRTVIALKKDPGPDTESSGRGVPNYVRALAVSPDGHTCWVPSVKHNTDRGPTRDGRLLNFQNTVRTNVSRIDVDTHREPIEKRLDFDDESLPSAVEFTRRGNYVLITLQGTNRIEVVDAYTGQSVAGANTGLAPHGLVLTPDDDRLFVLNYLSRSITVFNTASLSEGIDPGISNITEIDTVPEETLPPQVLRGKQIFYNAADRRMSRDNYLSCANCHLNGGQDGRVWDFTASGQGLRNTITLRGGATTLGNLHWSGNFDEIQDFEHDIRGRFGGTGFLPDEVYHKGTRDRPLGDPKKGLSNELDALAAYVQSLDVIPPSPHRAEDGSLTPEGKAGRQVFQNLNCQRCHGGDHFTDRSSGKRYKIVDAPHEPDQRFQTPPLEGIWYTPPYLHDGSAATLLDVFKQGKQNGPHGRVMNVDQQKRQQLIEFLKQIDGSSPAVSGDHK